MPFKIFASFWTHSRKHGELFDVDRPDGNSHFLPATRREGGLNHDPSRRQLLIGGIAVYVAPLGSRAYAALLDERLLTGPAWNARSDSLKYRIDARRRSPAPRCSRAISAPATCRTGRSSRRMRSCCAPPGRSALCRIRPVDAGRRPQA